MLKISDQQLNADITRTLRFDTLIPPQQQQHARERLLKLAAAQAILPPMEITAEAACKRTTWRGCVEMLQQHTSRFARAFIFDSSAYERTRRPHRFFRCYNLNGRCIFTVVHVAA